MRIALAASALLACGAALAQDFDACVKELRAEAGAGGISAAVIDNAFAGLQADPTVIERMESQPEFETPVERFATWLARLDDPEDD